MKFLHIGDLHIGKRLYGFSLLEEQRHILKQIESAAINKKVNGVLICGDVYDRAVPVEGAVSLLDDFLTGLLKEGLFVLMIAGNHDSPQRLQFGSRILENSGLHISGGYESKPKKVILKDEYSDVTFYLLPYIRPGDVQPQTNMEIKSSTDALRFALNMDKPDINKRNVLLAHQYVVKKGSSIDFSESEGLDIGGLEPVDASLLKDFDYVALGHIHKCQKSGWENIRYCGAPLKYAFSDKGSKGCLYVELMEKGNLYIEQIELKAKTPLVSKRDSLKNLLMDDKDKNNYIEAILTDEDELPMAMAKLKQAYPKIMHMRYDNTRTRAYENTIEAYVKKSIAEHFADFYKMQNGRDISQKQMEIIKDLIENNDTR